jgi:putative spermidine/putrescine transport system ATP-binding protein
VTTAKTAAEPGTDATGRPILELEALCKQFGRVDAVRDVNLELYDGESIALLGPSGSGKSTLLALIAGFHLPTAGRIMLRGEDVSRLSPAARKIGVVFQNYALFPHLTVAANVGYGLKMHRWPKADRRTRVEEMIDLVGLEGLGDRYPRQLSGGQQQRVALARALAFKPDLLLLDEPLAALDREIRLQMQSEIRRIRRQLKTTLIHVTHDREEAMALGDRIVILRDGEVVAAGTPTDLYSQPKSSFAAGFFSAFNLLAVEDCRVISDTAACVRWLGRDLEVACDTPLTGSGEVRLLVPRSGPRLGGRVARSELALQGELLDNVYLGDVAELTVRVSAGDLIVARVPAEEAGGASVGGSVTLRVDVSTLRAITIDRPSG